VILKPEKGVGVDEEKGFGKKEHTAQFTANFHASPFYPLQLEGAKGTSTKPPRQTSHSDGNRIRCLGPKDAALVLSGQIDVVV
jgi:hypothetical protein